MDPRRWQQIKEIFDQAVELDGSSRETLLDRACSGDVELRREVLDLIAADAEEQSVLDGESMTPAFGELLRRDAAAAAKGRRIGPYEIIEEIGRGGMAVVYSAMRADEHYRRRVALKLIKRGMETEAVIARFRQERQILAQLDHPSIARLYDGGVTDDGLPYLVMELVEGEPIHEYCSHHSLSVAQSLRLFREVAKAVHFAHRNLVVHRDLKPSNILVTHDGVPKLLDFGIAKILQPSDGTRLFSSTVFGQRPMTPEYASPEQIRGERVTTASDIYSLGVLLYRLLTGQRPYRFASTALAEVERVICDEDPERPSTAVSRVEPRDGEVRMPGLERLRKILRGDLDNIVLMALRKEPDRRYASAEQLAEDLRRYQEGLPVRARQDTPLYRATKFVQRNRIKVTAAVLVLVSLVAGIFTTAWQARVAKTQRITAERTRDFLVSLFEISHPEEAVGETITARKLLDQGAERIALELEDQPAVKATMMDAMGQAYTKLGLYEDAAPLLEEALTIRRQILDARDPEVAASLTHLGELRLLQALFTEALELNLEALALLREIGGDPALIAESEDQLGLVYLGQGKNRRAEEIFRTSLEWQENEFEEIHPARAATLNNLALALKARGELEEAEESIRRALEIHRELYFGETHRRVLTNKKNLAEILRSRGQCQEARKFYESVLESEKALLEGDHPGLATTLNSLAFCLMDLGELELAEELSRQSLESRRGALESDHPDVGDSLMNLGRLAFIKNDFEESERLSREALMVYRQREGPEHPNVARALGNLAGSLVRLGRLEEAETHYRDALAPSRRAGTDPVLIAGLLNNLAFLLAQREDFAEVEQRYREAIEIYERDLDPEHPEIAKIKRNLAEALLALGRAEEAETEFRDSLRRFEALDGDQSRQLAIVKVGLARAMMARARFGEAELHLRDAAAKWDALGARGRNGLAITEGELARCLEELGREAEAERLFESSYSTLNANLGPRHPRTVAARRALDEFYARRGPEETARAVGNQG